MDEMAQSQKDTTVASVVSLVLCALIFIYGYQETGRPVKATLCLIIGLGYTLAFATLAIGHLNILTITFLPILIGLAIDYGVHLISRYEEELRRGQERGGGVDQGHGLYRARHFYRRLDHRRRVPGDGADQLQGHSGDGDHLRRRPADLPGADDDPAAGAAVARAPERGGPRAGRARQRSGRGSRTSGCSGRRWTAGLTLALCGAGRHAAPQGLFRLQPAPHAERGLAGGGIRDRTSSIPRPSRSSSAPSSPPTSSRPSRSSNSLPTSPPSPASTPSPAS